MLADAFDDDDDDDYDDNCWCADTDNDINNNDIFIVLCAIQFGLKRCMIYVASVQ